jgi:peptidoglycan glycosyltransferase
VSFLKQINLVILILFSSVTVSAESKIYFTSNKSSKTSSVSNKSSSKNITSAKKGEAKKNTKLAKNTKTKKVKVAKVKTKKVVIAKSPSKSVVRVVKNDVDSNKLETQRANLSNTIVDQNQNEKIQESEETKVIIESEPVLRSAYAVNHVGPFRNKEGSKYFEVLPSGQKVVLTLDGRIQAEADNLLSTYDLPFASLVAIEPDTGRILALAGSSAQEANGQTLVARSSFPAASLFKMITAAAAVETVGVNSNTPINYRGGTYSLGKHNYLPNTKSDKAVMTIGTAMGKSCNPVFARVALNYLSPSLLRKYATNFGFGQQLSYDFPLRGSSISLSNDQYEFARTAAGFGDAYISPVHAAAIVAAIGNRGVMMRPYLVEGLVLSSNKIKLLDNMHVLDQSISPSTADEILTMMESTVKDGTARKHFRIASPSLREISVAAKTGTLRGPNPKGTYHWFTAVAPVVNPKIAISALVIDNGNAKVNGAGLGRRFLEKIFDQRGYVESAKEISQKQGKPVS